LNFNQIFQYGVSTPLIVGGLLSISLSLLIVITARWHGRYSLDTSRGVQKLHAFPTPRIGGLPVVLGLVAAMIVSPPELKSMLFTWLLAGAPAFAIGLIEDLTKRVSVQARLMVTMLSGVLACLITGYSLTGVNVLGLDWILQFTIVSVIFTAIAVGGIANAINIIDGLNGLASSMIIWALMGITVLAMSLGDTVLASLCLVIAACVLGFFVVNWPFGKLFLGDGGAYFLGFSLAWACVLLVERHHEVSAFSGLLLCIHPIVEVLYSVYRRKIRQQHPGRPDRLHFHSLVKRRVLQRLMPTSSKTLRNSAGGFLIGGISLLPAIILQWVYSSTLASLLSIIIFGFCYILLYQRIAGRIIH